MDKAEQPTVTQALKPCPEVEAIAQEIADRSAWKKTTDNYARIYQAAYAGAIAAMNTRTTSLAAQDGLVEALRVAREYVQNVVDAEGKAFNVRDLVQIDAALSARVETLETALVAEREDNLWNAYNTGHVKDDRWSHMFMSDGEWLAVECGFDCNLADFDDAAIRAAIPVAARKALGGSNG